MNPYLTLLKTRFSMMLQYRTAAWAGFMTQAFFGFVIVMRFIGFYESSIQQQPLALHETLSYIWLGQAMFSLIPFNLDAELAERIRSGNIAYELVRPVRIYPFWFARQVANRVVPFLLRGIPLFLFAILILPLAGLDYLSLGLPLNVESLCLFLISLVFAVLISSCFSMILNISLFWTISGEGMVYLAPAFFTFLSGIIIPIPFFPDWIRPLINLLPFRGLIDIPVQIYLGRISFIESVETMALQIVWIIILVFIGKMVLKRAMKRVIVQGG
jgi:ABC-2 type transport system permease protein